MSEISEQKQTVKQIDQRFRLRWRKWLLPWARFKGAKHKEHAPLVHAKNEGKGNPRMGFQDKLAGKSTGFPDLQLMVWNSKYKGLLIENKIGNNVRTDEQVLWADWLNSHGYLCVECRSVKEAVDTVVDYMEWTL